MKNLTFGENNLTAKGQATKKEEVVKNEVSDKEVLKITAELRKDLEKVIAGSRELYQLYPTNEISVAINSLQMAHDKFGVQCDKVKEFGK